MIDGSRSRLRMVAAFALVVAACGSGSGESRSTTAAIATTAALLENAVATIPDPVVAWTLDGDGDASASGPGLEFSGAHQLSEEAVSFDGHTGNGLTSEPVPVDTTRSFTVAAWVNYAAQSGIANAVSGLGEETALFGLGVGETAYTFGMKTEDRTGLDYAVWVEGPPKVATKLWTHLVGVHDADAGTLRLFVDGKLAGEEVFTTPLKAEGAVAIGRGQFDGHPGNFWPGAIGDVAIYDTALTADQIVVLHTATRPSALPPARPAPDPSSYADGILNGTWDWVMDAEMRALVEADLEAEAGKDADELRIRMGFDDHEWWLGFVFDGELWLLHGVPEGDAGTFYIEDDLLVQTGAQGEVRVTYEWVLDGDRLSLTAVEECQISTTLSCRDDRAQMDAMMLLVTEHTYTKSSDDPGY